MPAAQYHSRSQGTFMARLEKAWAIHREQRFLPATPMPVPVWCALAAYAAHIICKMNMNFGFGAHMPGVGRQQVTRPPTPTLTQP